MHQESAQIDPHQHPSTCTGNPEHHLVHSTKALSRDDHVPQVSPSSKDNCERRRPESEHSQLSHVPTKLVGKSVTPFLREHIPGLYAPVGKLGASAAMGRTKDPNSKYCYRHQPDARCRRAADEVKMEGIQRVGLSFNQMRFQLQTSF